MIGPFGMRPRGTMGVRALPMAKALVARGHAVTMLLPPWQNPEDAGKRWEEDGVAVENVHLPPRTPGLFHLLTALRLARRAVALQPDVIHLFKPKAYSGLAHWLLKTSEILKTSEVCPRLVVDTDDWEGAGGWNAIGGYSPTRQRFFAWQERWGLTHADAVTVASRTLESLVWALGVPPQRVSYVPNGVPGMQPEGSGTKNEGQRPPCILLYTRFFEFPVSRVIDVLKRVRERVPQARLLVVGKGLFGEEAELFRLAEQAGLTLTNYESRIADYDPRSVADIAYLGFVPAETLPGIFAQVDVAIYPFDDTLVNRAKCAVKLLDLLAAGVPVVAEAEGQNRETIRHGKTGWLAEPGDVEGFAGAVVRLLEDAPLRERLGSAAARDVRKRFAWERLVEKVERAYGVD